MDEYLLRARGRDPLLFRDGRPFSNELGALTARTLPVPAPGTLAGFIRSIVGDALGWRWTQGDTERARRIQVAGPILERHGKPVFAAPADAVVFDRDGGGREIMPLRPRAPLPEGAGCDLPAEIRPLAVTEDAKPLGGYAYWDANRMMEWLGDGAGRGRKPPEPINGPQTEERTHVKIDPETNRAEEGQLFTTEGVCFGEEWALMARVRADGVATPAGFASFGGERRLATVETADAGLPPCPDDLRDALAAARGVRLLLATPAVFARGWRQGWLDETLTGSPPGAPGVTLHLVAAAVKRREAVSGWDYEKRGPKPVRWMAPAGSVYFFEVVGDGGAATLADRAWLEPVSDDEQDRRDGYGLALWGVWDREGGLA